MIDINIKKNCTGCHSCYNICPTKSIEMKYDKEGFLYPNVNKSKCTNCDLCNKVCPLINKNKEIYNHPIAYSCINQDEKIRINSSSGGIFTVIATYVLENKGVVFGVKFDEDFNVVHDYIESIEDLYKFRGSKYTQSKIGTTYSEAKQFLNQGRIVLFTGTPCQIDGLKRFLGKEYNNLICQDIICHGVPSNYIWDYYKNIRRKNRLISNINFRDKQFGWQKYSVRFDYKDGSFDLIMQRDDYFMKCFLSDLCLRPSCYSCNYKSIHRKSDITLADFWGVEKVEPEMFDDKGTSIIFINSSKGKQIFEEINSKIYYKKVNIDDVIKYNPYAVRGAKYPKGRDIFLKKYHKNNFEQFVDYCSDYDNQTIEKRILRLLSRIKGRARYYLKFNR